MLKACVGTLNVWDYLEVTTKLDRGMCKRIAIMTQVDDTATVRTISAQFDVPAVDVMSVHNALRDWIDWVDRRQFHQEQAYVG